MRFPGDEDAEALRTDGREMDFRFHLQVVRGFADAALDFFLLKFCARPRSLERHAELAARDGFFHRLDVRAVLTAKLGDAGAKSRTGTAETQALSILTPDQQAEYNQAHAKALADDPALETENEALKEEYISVMTNGTPAQKQVIVEMVASHRLKLRKAMLKEDPKLGPIFAKIDKSISELKAKGTTSPN